MQLHTPTMEGYISTTTDVAVKLPQLRSAPDAEVETLQHHAAPRIPGRWKQHPDGKFQWIPPPKKKCMVRLN